MATDPETLADLLADAGLRLKRQTPGHTEKLLCPRCSGGRTREISLSVSIDDDGAGVVYRCHRGSCGWSGGGRTDGARRGLQRDRPLRKPDPHPAAQTEFRPDWLCEVFAARRIGLRTLQDLGIYALPARSFPGTGQRPAIVFPYRHNGEVVNRKYRPHPDKNPMMQEPDALPTLYNADCLAGAPEELIWVEGEIDVAALWECGFRAVVTLKDGAPASAPRSDGVDDKRFAALRVHAEALGRVKRFVLAGDTDAPGRLLREELARRLGRHRCRIVDWPAGCKDASDALREHGPEAVQALVAESSPYPIEGLRSTFGGRLLALRDTPPPAVMTTGCLATDEICKLPADGRLIVVTGYPGAGKALALDTAVPTPAGWRTMGELTDGDCVYAADGTITRVAVAHPVMRGRECLRVTLDDGSQFVCDADHLWLTDTRQSRTSAARQARRSGETKPRGTDQRHLCAQPAVRTAREIMDTLTHTDSPGVSRVNHSIRLAEPISGGAVWPVEIAPYLLGAWLGNGDSSGGNMTFDPRDIPHYRAEIEAEGSKTSQQPSDEMKLRAIGLTSALRRCGLLWNKHVPAGCLRAPVEQRLALLAGLMDTDGYADEGGSCEFCSTTQNLADSVYELICGLGMKGAIAQGRAMLYEKDCGPKFRVYFTPTRQVFRLARKAGRWEGAPRRSCLGHRMIVGVEPVESVPVRCITVAHPGSLYLVGKGFVPTHNTAWTRWLMVHTAKHFGRRWVVFSPEMQPWEEFVAACAEVVIGKPFWPVLGRERMSVPDVLRAEAWLTDRIAMMVSDSEDTAPTLEWLFDLARLAILRDGATDVLIDPWNELEHAAPPGVSETDYTGRALQRVKAFGRRHGCNVWIVAHPAKPLRLRPGEIRKAPGLYEISGSAHWANRTDLGLVVHAERQGFAAISVVKSRMRRWGTRGGHALLAYDDVTGCYSVPAAGPELGEGGQDDQ